MWFFSIFLDMQGKSVGEEAEGEKGMPRIDGDGDKNLGQSVCSGDAEDVCSGGMRLDAVYIWFAVGKVVLLWRVSCGQCLWGSARMSRSPLQVYDYTVYGWQLKSVRVDVRR